MLLSKSLRPLRPLLLAGICLCVCGTPVHLPAVQRIQGGDCSGGCAGSLKPQNLRSEPSGVKSVTGPLWKVDAGGAAPHEAPTGESLVTQAENWDGRDGISGSTVAGGGVWNDRGEIKKFGIASQTRDSQTQSSPFPDHPVPPKQAHVPTARFPLDGILAPSSTSPQMNITKRASTDQGDSEDKEQEPDWTDYHPSSIPPLDFITPQNAAPIWDQYGPTEPSLPDPLLPDIGTNLMPKEDGPESVWTEATRASEGKRPTGAHWS
ncbi:unnamed protein product [Tetraodon nigroviridis]|uniref:(spotted green pufferfish) hypothetical protein n=1 Tax=Tetraodon nigroviridis TaxID=99883 RepID=Q4TCQ7_TETNG|nr:unnamed protein product [Tetraodon nigroviridis]